MSRSDIAQLMMLGVGYNVECGKLILRSLDDGRFAVSYDLENPSESWEKEYQPSQLDSAIEYFLQHAEKL